MLAEAEVVIVGGGPAGLATALELHLAGHEALILDRARPPIDKACGEGLMPDGVRALERLGVELDKDEWTPFWGIRYLAGELQAAARFPTGPGAGIRRTSLHRAMVERVEALGIRSLWGVAVQGLRNSELTTDKGQIRATWIVGADGLHSRIRRWAGLASEKARFHRFGIRRHYQVPPWSDLVEVYWADNCEAYVTPVSPGEVGVAILWSDRKADFETLLTLFPSLEDRLRGASTTSSDRGAAQLEQRTRAAYRGQVALVGDAAGYRDAITGEGLSLAFHEARALAAAISRGRLEEYGRAARRLSALPFFLIRLLLEVERRPRLRHRLIRTLANEPGLFAKLLAIHAREAPPRSVGPRGALQLARALLG